MTASLQQLMAASAMATALQKICSAGVLPENEEANLRVLVVRACRAFEIPTIAERSETQRVTDACP